MGRHFSQLQYSSSEDEGEDGNAEAYEDDECGCEEDSDDEDTDCMFYKSLPSSYAFSDLTWTVPDDQYPLRPLADPLVDTYRERGPGQPSQSSDAGVMVGMTRNVESENAVRSEAAEEKEGEIESSEENQAPNKVEDQRSSSPSTYVDMGDLHQTSTTGQPAVGFDPLTLRSEPSEVGESSPQSIVLTGTQAATEVRAEGEYVSSRLMIGPGAGSLEVTTPPSHEMEAPALPDGTVDMVTEFCDDLPDPPSDFWVWEDEESNGVGVEAGQVRLETDYVGEEIYAGAPDGEPEGAKGYDRDSQGPEAEVCMLAHKGQDAAWEMVQWPTEPSEGRFGSLEEIEIIPRDREQQSGEGETEIQFMELPDYHIFEERMTEHEEVKMVQKDEAGITEAPIEGSGKMFEEQTSKYQREMEDEQLIESDSREEDVQYDKHDRRDVKNQDEQGNMSISADGKIIKAKPEALETETKGSRPTTVHSQPLISTDKKVERTNVRWRDMPESEQVTAKEHLEVDCSVVYGKGVGRKLVISHQSPSKVYQVRSVPIVPPKPQHCRLTALNLRQQQQQQQQQSEGRNPDREQEWKKETSREDINARELEAVADGVEGIQGEVKQRKGILEAERHRRSSDWEEITVKDAGAKNNPLSMCFDEAVAKATMRREREREGSERERQKDRGCE